MLLFIFPSKNWAPRRRLVCVLSGLLALPCIGNAAPPIILVNPYDDIDWSTSLQHRANLHTHTTQSDGALHPEDVIDFYYKQGYTILALTDHNRCTWPWESWGRSPEALGMLAISGNEYSRHDHLNGYFLCHETTSTSLTQTLREIATLGGVAHLNHPGRYWNLVDGQVPPATLQKYASLFSGFSQELLLGIEVINSRNRYPQDVLLWDALLIELMPERSVWGFATDDMHTLGSSSTPLAGISWCVFPLQEMSPASTLMFAPSCWMKEEGPTPIPSHCTMNKASYV